MAQFLTTAEVADAADRSIRTVSRWIADGRLQPALKIPGRTGAYLFDPQHVAEVLTHQGKKAA